MTKDKARQRPPLSKKRILRAAVRLIDREGLDALTMRRLGSELKVEAMSLYKHVTNKDEILDGIVEQVFGEIELPNDEDDWRESMRRRAVSAREVLQGHAWAIGLLEERGLVGPVSLRYSDAILGKLHSSGISIEDSIHAFVLLDSYVYGHVVQEAGMANTARDGAPPNTDSDALAGYPNLAKAASHALQFGTSLETEFDYGLDLILSALEKTIVQS